MASKKNTFKLAFNAPVILIFTGICFVALLLSYMTDGKSNSLLFSTYNTTLIDPLLYIRLIGHVFGHTGWDHFIGNIMLILLIGPLLEEKYGSLNLVVVIGVTAVLTGIVHNIMFPGVELLGASGVVFAFILLSSFTGIKGNSIPVTFILVALVYMLQEVFNAFFGQEQIAYLTHILGGLIGARFGYIMNIHNKR